MKNAYNVITLCYTSLASACKRLRKLFVKNKKAAEHCASSARNSYFTYRIDGIDLHITKHYSKEQSLFKIVNDSTDERMAKWLKA